MTTTREKILIGCSVGGAVLSGAFLARQKVGTAPMIIGTALAGAAGGLLAGLVMGPPKLAEVTAEIAEATPGFTLDQMLDELQALAG